MSDHLRKKCWLIGAGNIAREYYRVLKDMRMPVQVVGKGEKSAKDFADLFGIKPSTGGIDSYIQTNPRAPASAIVAVDIPHLVSVSSSLIKLGIPKILIEKPVSFKAEEIRNLISQNAGGKSHIYVAYNRRFFASTQKCQTIISQDGGVTSFNFEFTEWTHKLKDLRLSANLKKNWLLANSTHVIDLAFFLGGEPSELSAYIGRGNSWPGNSRFTGAGKTKSGAIFSYHSNWESPGRWGLEVLTKKHRLTLRPLEELKIQEIGALDPRPVKISNILDLKYKPGFYRQVEAFLHNDIDRSLLTLEQHAARYTTYHQIAHGK